MKPKNILLSVIALIHLFLYSCSPKVPKLEEPPLTLLRNQTLTQGTLQVWTDGKMKSIHRSNIDTLAIAVSNNVNSYINSLNPEYLANADFVFINYYPGRDICNSTGAATRNQIGRGNKKFNQEIKKQNQVTQLSVFKDNEGISRWDKNRHYFSDENNLIGKIFFEHHYPCSSYVILHRSGTYYSYFGESWLKKRMIDLDLFVESVNKGCL